VGDLSETAPPTLIDRGDGARIACRFRAGRGPALLFLPGYASDMMGSKALALDEWAQRTGHALLRFDYSGCGESEGRFEEATLATWRDDALAVIDACDGEVVLVGSSMGGWLMLLAALARPDRVRALIGIAAAPDFTDWGFDADQRATLLRDGRIEERSAYSDTPFVTTRAFWESGQAHLLLEREIGFDGAVRLLQGQADGDVPWGTATRLAGALRSAEVQTILVKDGDHRLSRAQDIALLLRTVESLLERL
jgi:pimeloyl-ACP methyl ester carboxylesterase